MKVALALSVLLLVLTARECCSTISIGDLTPETAKQLRTLMHAGLTELKPDCGHRQKPSVTFLLYTRSSTDDPLNLDISNVGDIDSNKKLLLLIHGWLSGPTTSGILKIKDAYLKRYDCNVVVVDWSQLAAQPYTVSFCSLVGVAQLVTKFICYLHNELQVQVGALHILGHSMGAHVAGLVGQSVTVRLTEKVGRITGLDPSGPIFHKLGAGQRLDKRDARFVDVIHTDTSRLGTFVNCGHVDFHPNCARCQPGCPHTNNLGNDTLLSDVMCNTYRSLEYMAESINSNHFLAVSCGFCPRRCHVDIISEKYAVMGEDCRGPQEAKNFYIRTRSSPPYAEGSLPYV